MISRQGFPDAIRTYGSLKEIGTTPDQRTNELHHALLVASALRLCGSNGMCIIYSFWTYSHLYLARWRAWLSVTCQLRLSLRFPVRQLEGQRKGNDGRHAAAGWLVGLSPPLIPQGE